MIKTRSASCKDQAFFTICLAKCSTYIEALSCQPLLSLDFLVICLYNKRGKKVKRYVSDIDIGQVGFSVCRFDILTITLFIRSSISLFSRWLQPER